MARRILLGYLSLCLLGGCIRELQAPTAKILRPARMSPDAVGLDILFARVDQSRAENLERDLWPEIDEQFLSPELRQRLRLNGLRAGVVGSPWPAALESLLEIDKETVPQKLGLGAKVDPDPQVNRRFLELRSGKRGEIQASSIVDVMTVLLPRGEQLVGRTFEKGQGILAIKAEPTADGRLRLELTPEIQHGEAVGRFQPTQDGMFVVDSKRKTDTYGELRMEIVLSPGELLVLSSVLGRPGSVGDHFFSKGAEGQREHRILVIRVASRSGEGDL